MENGLKILDQGEDYWKTRDYEFFFISEIIKYGEGLNLEFGVFEAATINMLSSLRPEQHFYGFDSFEGLPEDWDHGTKNKKKGHFSLKGTLPNVNSNVTLIKGFYNDTLENFLKDKEGQKINFLHLDSDLYSSTKYVLDMVHKYKMNLKGCIIRFDDYCDWRLHFDKPDSRKPIMSYTKWRENDYKAWNEWVENNKIEYEEIARNWDKSYIIQIL